MSQFSLRIRQIFNRSLFFFFFFTMRLKPANLKSEDFKYVGPAKKIFFKQNQQGG